MTSKPLCLAYNLTCAQQTEYSAAPPDRARVQTLVLSLLHRLFKQRGREHVALQVPELLGEVSPGKDKGQHLLGAKGLLGVPKKGQAEGEALDGLLPLQPAASAFFGVGLRLEPVSNLLNALQAAQSASAHRRWREWWEWLSGACSRPSCSHSYVQLSCSGRPQELRRPCTALQWWAAALINTRFGNRCHRLMCLPKGRPTYVGAADSHAPGRGRRAGCRAQRALGPWQAPCEPLACWVPDQAPGWDPQP